MSKLSFYNSNIYSFSEILYRKLLSSCTWVQNYFAVSIFNKCYNINKGGRIIKLGLNIANGLYTYQISFLDCPNTNGKITVIK